MNITNKFKILKGIVVSNKMNKTIVVKVERKVNHSKYFKIIKKFTKYYVHNENNVCNIGDMVSFKKTSPISKKKHWILI